MQSKPDRKLMQEEARAQVKRALASYPHERHVLLYAAHDLLQHHPDIDHGWNELQRRSDLPAERLADALIAVDEHLREHLKDYMY